MGYAVLELFKDLFFVNALFLIFLLPVGDTKLHDIERCKK